MSRISFVFISSHRVARCLRLDGTVLCNSVPLVFHGTPAKNMCLSFYIYPFLLKLHRLCVALSLINIYRVLLNCSFRMKLWTSDVINLKKAQHLPGISRIWCDFGFYSLRSSVCPQFSSAHHSAAVKRCSPALHARFCWLLISAQDVYFCKIIQHWIWTKCLKRSETWSCFLPSFS